MSANMMRRFFNKLPVLVKNGVKKIPWSKGLDYIKKPTVWIAFGSGIAGGVLLQQPKVSKLQKEARLARSREERLKVMIFQYHEAFIVTKAEKEVLQAKNNIDGAKKKEIAGRSLILYEYATKEYIEICLKIRHAHGKNSLSDKEIKHYKLFQRVLNGKELVKEDAKSIQNYIYPKYKSQIDGLIEYDFGELLAQMTMI